MFHFRNNPAKLRRYRSARSLPLALKADVKCGGEVKLKMILDVTLVQLCGKKTSMSDLEVYLQLTCLAEQKKNVSVFRLCNRSHKITEVSEISDIVG